MPLPVSKKRLSRLGAALLSGQATDEDWQLYGEVLDHYDEHTAHVRAAIDGVDWPSLLGRRVEMSVTGRTKTLGTLLDKLERQPEIKLPYIRDISGVRIVGDLLLGEQDRVADIVADLFHCPQAARVDRRESPESGYRALHVVITRDGLLAEVQIRTELQALWADLYERLADNWGRQLRYGEGPSPDSHGVVFRRAEVVAHVQQMSVVRIARIEQLRQRVARLRADVLAHQEELGRSKRARGPQAVAEQSRIRVFVSKFSREVADLEAEVLHISSDLKGQLEQLARDAEQVP